MAGEMAAVILTPLAVPVIYYMLHQREDEAKHAKPAAISELVGE